MNKNKDKNIFCQQINYLCQYLQYTRFKRMGLWKRKQQLSCSPRAEMQNGHFQVISFGSIIRNLITFEMTSSEIGTVSVRCFIVIQCTVKTYWSLWTHFVSNRTRKPTKEALIRVDKRCQSFLVSFFLYYSARFNQITGNHYWQDLQ